MECGMGSDKVKWDRVLRNIYKTDSKQATKQPLQANASGQDYAVPWHLKEKDHAFYDNYVSILARGDRRYERREK